MKHLIGIGFQNRPDLLRKALDSIRPYWAHTVVVDNSDARSLRAECWLKRRVRVAEPPVPFTFPQMMNWLREQAEASGCPVMMIMHNDAEAHPGTPAAFLRVLRRLEESGRRWGAAFTNYDILAAFNVKAMQTVGPWDTTFTQYCSDTDYYWRLKSAGYELVWSGLGVSHHNSGSNTMKADEFRKHQVWASSPGIYDPYFIRKWGRAWTYPEDLAFADKWHKEPFAPPAAETTAGAAHL